MASEIGQLQPLRQFTGRRIAVDVYDTLLDAILRGAIRPGAILSQVEVARQLSVSRTPVREAMRKLQEAGLLSGEPNLRSRVLAFNPQDIEALYVKRIVMEAMAVAITTFRCDELLIDEIDATVRQLEGEPAHSDFQTWQELHRHFHRLIISRAGDALAADLEPLERLSERYQSAHKGQHLPGWWQRGEEEHRTLRDAIARGDAARAGELAARHLARTALELLAALAPEHDTSRMRLALRFAIAGAAATAG